VQVDSIVHDSVLTTLLSAARAYTPEAKALAATMAGNAIGYLRDAALVQPDDGSTVRLRAVSQRVADAAAGMARPFQIRSVDVGPRSVPAPVGEAIVSAATQAMVNSVQHEVGDNGAGFDTETVPTERLGLRVSIVERVGNAGGAATVVSAPHRGTTVSIQWPSPKSDASSPVDTQLELLAAESGSTS
jgi:hypothetical protein